MQKQHRVLVITDSGNVRIGDSEILKPSGAKALAGRQVQDDSGGAYKLAVGGEVAAEGFVNVSTAEAKKDIVYLNEQDYDQALEKILGAKVARYNYEGEDAFSCEEFKAKLSEESLALGNEVLGNETGSCARRLGLIAEEAPKEILSVNGKGVDLYKMASLMMAGMKAQQKQIDKLKMDMEELQAKIAALGVPPLGGDGLVLKDGLQTGLGAVLNAFRNLGAIFENGAARFQNLFVRTITIEKSGAAQEEAIGEGIIPAGSVEYEIKSDKIDDKAKIFITFRGDYGSRWWIDKQATSTAVVKIAQPLDYDVRFDWWVVGVTAEQTQNPSMDSGQTQNNAENVLAPVSAPEEAPAPAPTPAVEQQTEPASEPTISPVQEPEPAETQTQQEEQSVVPAAN